MNDDAAMVVSMGGGSARMVSSRMRREERLSLGYQVWRYRRTPSVAPLRRNGSALM